MEELAPCRTCKNFNETKVEIFTCARGSLTGTCKHGIEMPSFSCYGEASQEEGEKLCRMYLHEPFPW